MPGQFEVMIERNFSSAHQLRGYRGKCENLHGHNYKIEIYARGKELNNIGLLVDFVELKQAADDLVTYLDHKNLNELEPFVVEQNPSAENVARFVLEKLAAKINDERVQIDRKSTRLNSSHSQISYAVFCLKKKKKNIRESMVRKKDRK